ncbi:MAG TPA: choice-of-anchor tandem repeat GloVer-containing protein [Candidatus Acidoferrum sp.]|nr:choice-of-anchor tandem repeat GloVer-containing protein [Candidatus Acidoferrum sp.]
MKTNVKHLLITLALLAVIPPAGAQSGFTFSNLVTFSGANGLGPQNLVPGTNGALYGATYAGGTNGYGEVFQVTTNGSFMELFAFNGNNGAYPDYLTAGNDGNIYGITGGTVNEGTGGSDSWGELFQMTTGGALTVLHPLNGSGGEGSHPSAPLVEGSDGSFYGTTMFYGADFDGTVFRFFNGTLAVLAPIHNTGANNPTFLALNGGIYGVEAYGGSGDTGAVVEFKSGALTTLSSFTGPNGDYPQGLVNGNDGNFYAVTSAGGAGSDGTFCRITAAGAITTLFSFSGTNGNSPNSLILGKDGNFYGTTGYGGANSNTSTSGDGTVFKITPGGALAVLFSFAGTNGAIPNSLLQTGDGSLYGTTSYGDGSVFALRAGPPTLGIAESGNQSVLYWPSSAANFVLQTTTNVASGNWANVTNGTSITGVMVPNTSPAGFFRLQEQ